LHANYVIKQITDRDCATDNSAVQIVSDASYEDLMSAAEVFIGMQQQGNNNSALVIQLLSAALELKPFDLQVLLIHTFSNHIRNVFP
jgi:hypothetical protein